MLFFALNDDVKSIITKHLIHDLSVNFFFMTPDDDLQIILFGEVIEMKMSIFEITDCLVENNNNKNDDMDF